MKCYEFNKNCQKKCERKNCRYWINKESSNNCCINLIRENNEAKDKFTLQDIGDLFKVTRMRICQIEKIAIKKLKDKIKI